MNEVVIFTADFSDDPWEILIFGDVFANLGPQSLECWNASGEIDTGEIGGCCDGVAEYGAVRGNEVNDAWGYSCFQADLHYEVVAKSRRIAWF